MFHTVVQVSASRLPRCIDSMFTVAPDISFGGRRGNSDEEITRCSLRVFATMVRSDALQQELTRQDH